jgi:hypothetical protein
MPNFAELFSQTRADNRHEVEATAFVYYTHAMRHDHISAADKGSYPKGCKGVRSAGREFYAEGKP